MKLPKMLWAVAVPLDLEPMEVSLVEHLPEGDRQYEPKWMASGASLSAR
jgi:hypothetical protein